MISPQIFNFKNMLGKLERGSKVSDLVADIEEAKASLASANERLKHSVDACLAVILGPNGDRGYVIGEPKYITEPGKWEGEFLPGVEVVIDRFSGSGAERAIEKLKSEPGVATQDLPRGPGFIDKVSVLISLETMQDLLGEEVVEKVEDTSAVTTVVTGISEAARRARKNGFGPW